MADRFIRSSKLLLTQLRGKSLFVTGLFSCRRILSVFLDFNCGKRFQWCISLLYHTTYTYYLPTLTRSPPTWLPLNMYSLFGGEEFVEGPGSSHLHDEHQIVSVAQAEHADDEGVTELVHDLCLPHHLLLHQLLILTLQHFDSHIYLTPDANEQEQNACSYCACTAVIQRLVFMTFKSHDSVLRTPFFTQPKFPDPSSTSSISSWSLWMLNLLISFGLWYGLNPAQSIGRRSRSSGLEAPSGAN